MRVAAVISVLLLFVWVQAEAADVSATIATNVSASPQLLNLHRRGFTNVTEAELKGDPAVWMARIFIVHAALPGHIRDWPRPQDLDTNCNTGALQFVAKHGWCMYAGQNLPAALIWCTNKISGLPWPEIKDLEYDALTHDGILYVVLRGFGGECDGVAWNPRTNRFDRSISFFRPLGKGWYAWRRDDPPGPGDQVYEGETVKHGQPDGPSNGNQPIRSETNRTSTAVGSHR